MEDSQLQARIENIHEDLISNMCCNKRAHLSLALERKQAMEIFGEDSFDRVTKSGREALRHACLAPEKSDGQTTANEILLLKRPQRNTEFASSKSLWQDLERLLLSGEQD